MADPPARRAVLLAPGAGRSYPGGPVSAVVKADGEETAGRYHISEWWLEPHTQGPGLHSHPEDDVFHVLEGTMHLCAAGVWHEAPPGSFLLVPGGVPHAFENRGDVRAGALNVSVPGDFEVRMPDIAAWFRARSPEDAAC